MGIAALDAEEVKTKIKLRRIPMTSREWELVELLCEANNTIDDLVVNILEDDDVSARSVKQMRNNIKDLKKKMNCSINEIEGVYHIDYK